MNLIIQPDDGLAPLLQAVRHAKQNIDILIFRFDRPELEKALEAAVARGVVVRALIAHTNRGGEKGLRKLETKMLAAGVIVARTADDLLRYHGKMMIVDDELYVLGFNYTKLDIEKSRSFGIVTKDPRLVKEATALFEADSTRQPLHAESRPSRGQPGIVAEDSRGVHRGREEAAAHLRRESQRSEDGEAADGAAQGRASTSGCWGRPARAVTGIEARKMPGLRLHVRAIDPRRLVGVRRQPEPAQARARRPPRSRGDCQ